MILVNGRNRAVAPFSWRWNTQLGMTLEECRRFYAEEIRYAANLSTAALIEAFARVPRENFLGPGPWKIAGADLTGGGAIYIPTEDDDPRRVYHNVAIGLDPSRNLNNGQPGSLAHWIEALNLKEGERVFHLGCGVGYFTAIIAETVGPNGFVVASEVDPNLAVRAQENLRSYSNVSVHAVDGMNLDSGTIDAILINAGVTHPHRPWLEKLQESGRIVLPLTVPMGNTGLGKGVMARIVREPKADDGTPRFSAGVLTFVAIYHCSGGRDAQLEPALGKAFATGALMKMKSARLDQHEPAEGCLLHRDDVCLSGTALR
jgi:protein-L-isoaspartate(D-aspartate) O-methyltransferase